MFDPNQPLPDFQTQQLEVQRRRAMADMLRKQAGTPMPTGQMVGNRFVAPSFAQYLPGLLNAGQSAYAQTQADQAEKDYGQQVAQAKQQWASALPQATAGMPGREEMYGPAAMGGSPELAAVPAVAPTRPATDAVLKATIAGLGIPGNEKVAQLWGQGMLAENTREDTQAARKEETAARLAQERELKLTMLAQQKEIADRNAANAAATIEQRAQAAKDSARISEMMVEMQRERTQANVQMNALTNAVRAAKGGGGDGEGKAKFQQVDNAGNVTFFDEQGRPLRTQAGAGKPSAAFEKITNQKKQLNVDLDRAITELTDVTKDGGLIDQSTGSGIGRGVDIAAGMFGKATPGAIAIGKLAPIADMALKMVPRFEGPQSDKDTRSYKEAAGQMADPTLPTAIRKAASQEVLRLMKERKNQFVTKDMAADGAGAPGAPGGVDTSNPLLK